MLRHNPSHITIRAQGKLHRFRVQSSIKQLTYKPHITRQPYCLQNSTRLTKLLKLADVVQRLPKKKKRKKRNRKRKERKNCPSLKERKKKNKKEKKREKPRYVDMHQSSRIQITGCACSCDNQRAGLCLILIGDQT